MHHPELEDVWGDLEKKVKPVKPEEAKQPEGLKVTLLPFQRESLFWMRKQEAGPWTGGMLAVSGRVRSDLDDELTVRLCSRTKWEWERLFRPWRCSLAIGRSPT